MFHTFLEKLHSFLEARNIPKLTIFLTPIKKMEYQQVENKQKLVREKVFENIKQRNPDEEVDPARIDSAIEELRIAFSPEQTLYDSIIDGVPEYIWDQEKNPKHPENPEILALLEKIEKLIISKSPWLKKI